MCSIIVLRCRLDSQFLNQNRPKDSRTISLTRICKLIYPSVLRFFQEHNRPNNGSTHRASSTSKSTQRTPKWRTDYCHGINITDKLWQHSESAVLTTLFKIKLHIDFSNSKTFALLSNPQKIHRLKVVNSDV